MALSHSNSQSGHFIHLHKSPRLKSFYCYSTLACISYRLITTSIVDPSPHPIAKLFTPSTSNSDPSILLPTTVVVFPTNPHSRLSKPDLTVNMRLTALVQLLLVFPFTTSALDASPSSTLNVTVLGARHNRSTLECWALQPGFETSDVAGISGSSIVGLGVVDGNVSFTSLPAGFDGGRHNAPALQ